MKTSTYIISSTLYIYFLQYYDILFYIIACQHNVKNKTVLQYKRIGTFSVNQTSPTPLEQPPTQQLIIRTCKL